MRAGRRRNRPRESRALDYTVTVGATRIAYTECPSDADPPTATMALVSRLREATA